MGKKRLLALGLAGFLLLPGCGGDDGPPDPAEVLADATRAMKQVPSVTRVKTMTSAEVNAFDPAENGELRAGAIVYDESATCSVPDLACGAVIEVWKDAETARFKAGEARALDQVELPQDYERIVLNDHTVLRVSLDLDREVIDAYVAAFEA